MNSTLRISLSTNAEQFARLLALQSSFAGVCNALAPTVQVTRVWNRVALHHLAYRTLRERFPEMGSQMVCNAIYSVSRTCRLLFQHPQSPFHLAKLGDRPLPLLRFTDTSPVYFDRHTLSVKDGQLSMYTLDGRMRFALALGPADENSFKTKKLREIVLARRVVDAFELTFAFGESEEPEPAPTSGALPGRVIQSEIAAMELPEYVLVEESI